MVPQLVRSAESIILRGFPMEPTLPPPSSSSLSSSSASSSTPSPFHHSQAHQERGTICILPAAVFGLFLLLPLCLLASNMAPIGLMNSEYHFQGLVASSTIIITASAEGSSANQRFRNVPTSYSGLPKMEPPLPIDDLTSSTCC